MALSGYQARYRRALVLRRGTEAVGRGMAWTGLCANGTQAGQRGKGTPFTRLLGRLGEQCWGRPSTDRTGGGVSAQGAVRAADPVLRKALAVDLHSGCR